MISFQGPFSILGYDRQKWSNEQTSSFPKTFLDAMAVREAVFVKEQKVPLAMEAEPNDGLCCHWVVYTTSKTNSESAIPVATIRLVPYPHDPHPEPGWSWEPEEPAPGEDLVIRFVSMPEYVSDRKTTFHDGLEPYVKLGRMAVLPEYRGFGYASQLVKTALAWLRNNSNYFQGLRDGNLTADEKTRERQDLGEIPPWKGLVCVHAQKQVEAAWAKWGFELDKDMGTWFEADIPHVGMFQRLEID